VPHLRPTYLHDDQYGRNYGFPGRSGL